MNGTNENDGISYHTQALAEARAAVAFHTMQAHMAFLSNAQREQHRDLARQAQEDAANHALALTLLRSGKGK